MEVTVDPCLVLGTESFTQKFLDALKVETTCNGCIRQSGSFINTLKTLCNETTLIKTGETGRINSLLGALQRYIKQLATTKQHCTIVILPTLQVSNTYFELRNKTKGIKFTEGSLVRRFNSIPINAGSSRPADLIKDLRNLVVKLGCEFWCVYVDTETEKLDWITSNLFTTLIQTLNNKCDTCGRSLTLTLDQVATDTIRFDYFCTEQAAMRA